MNSSNDGSGIIVSYSKKRQKWSIHISVLHLGKLQIIYFYHTSDDEIISILNVAKNFLKRKLDFKIIKPGILKELAEDFFGVLILIFNIFWNT